ncbi:MAG: pyruvate, phosphate dikinase/phosphoenolpyruvate synthase regulator [Acidobacteria bacterium]|nr:pyruvate, phosphate dikinase/phosphoenolpyruvate synthase regulator [Acidobacteriota bacterium]
MAADPEPTETVPASPPPVPVYFVAEQTGISAEAMGNALLVQFPDIVFERHRIPFITSIAEARRAVAVLDAAMKGPRQPLVFTTIADDTISGILRSSRAPIIDFVSSHLGQLERILGSRALHLAVRVHGVDDLAKYDRRMAAVEYAIEHDDGESLRHYDDADVILLAPSRCGKTPTTMYLALQHSVFVANYPLVPEDLETIDLPDPVRKLRARCFGILTTPERLAQVRHERRPDSTYSSIEQCRWELKRAEIMFRSHRIPTVNSSAKSVEEMSTVILQHLNRP